MESIPRSVRMDGIVIKSGRFIDASYTLTRREMQLILMVGSLVTEDDVNGREPKKYSISVSSMIRLIDPDNSQLYKEIRQAAKRLSERPISIREELDSGFVERQTNWISYSYYHGKGILEVELSSFLLPYLYQLQNQYSKTILSTITAVRLGDFYSMRIYEKLKRHQVEKEFVWSVDEIRFFLDLTSEKYPRYANLKQRILTPAFETISKKTELDASFSEVMEGKKVVAIVCKMKEKTVASMRTDELLPRNCDERVRQRLLSAGFSPGRCDSLLRAYVDDKMIEETLDLYETQKGNVKVATAWIVAALRDEYVKNGQIFPTTPSVENKNAVPLLVLDDPVVTEPQQFTELGLEFLESQPTEEKERLFQNFITEGASLVVQELYKRHKNPDSLVIHSSFLSWLGRQQNSI